MQFFLFLLLCFVYSVSDAEIEENAQQVKENAENKFPGLEKEEAEPVQEETCSDGDLTPFEKAFNAAGEGDLEKVKSILEGMEFMVAITSEESSIDKIVTEGQNILFAACIRGSVDVVEYLVETMGSDMNFKDKNGYDCLYVAGVRGNLKLFKYLLKKGMDPMAKYEDGRTAFHITCRSVTGAEMKIVNHVLKKGYDVDEPQRHDETCLMEAVSAMNLNLVQFLLKKHADPDAVNVDERSAIHYAFFIIRTFDEKAKLTDEKYDTMKKIVYSLVKARANIFKLDKFYQSVVNPAEKGARNYFQEVFPISPGDTENADDYAHKCYEYAKSKLPKKKKKVKKKKMKKDGEVKEKKSKGAEPVETTSVKETGYKDEL